MPDIDEFILRDLMIRGTADVHADPAIGRSVASRQRRRERRSAIRRTVTTGVAAAGALGVVAAYATGGHTPAPSSSARARLAKAASTSARLSKAAPQPKVAPLHSIHLTAAHKALDRLSRTAAKVPSSPEGRYLTMVDDQANSASGYSTVQTTVWDSVTGDVWTTQTGSGVPNSFPEQVHGSPTGAEFAAMPTDPSALRSLLLREAKVQQTRGRLANLRTLRADGTSTRAERKALSSPPEWSDAALVFQQANYLLYNPLVDPKLRAALLDVLADTPGVDVDSNATDARNQPAVEITFTDVADDAESYVQSTFMDPSTTTVLEQTQTLSNKEANASDTTTDSYVSTTSSDTGPVS
jgi:hypothetical protein